MIRVSFNRAILLFSLLLSVAVLTGCASSKTDPEDMKKVGNNTLNIPDMVRYFEKNKIPIDSINLLRADVIHADDALSIRVAGKEIGIYKFNVNIRKQREKLARIIDDNFVYLVGFKKDVVINGAFIMVGCKDNPKKEILEKAFMSFK